MSGRPPAPRTYTIADASFTAPALPAALYIVATPIGNLGDVTLRALATLAAADVIACEDTRVTTRLIRAYGIATALTPYHEHNADRAQPALLAAIAAGKAVALVSDAGTPLISDPGSRLVAAALAAGLPVIPIPGPSAAVSALAAAGLPADAFMFVGFLPTKPGQRRARLRTLAAVPATLVMYESPHRVGETLQDAATVLGPDRSAVVARELTKLHETFSRGSVAELAAAFTATEPPKGEITLMIGPPAEEAGDPGDDVVDAALATLSALSVGEAAATVAAATGLPRRVVYARALALRRSGSGER